MDVDAGTRLVENEQVGVGDECPCEQKSAFHPARQPVKTGVALVVDADLFEHLVGAFARLARGNPVVARLVFEHLADGEKAVDVELLWGEPDDVTGRPVVGFDVVAEHAGGAARATDEADQNVDERRFARAVRAEQPEETAFGNGERDAVECGHVVVHFGEILDVERRLGSGHS